MRVLSLDTSSQVLSVAVVDVADSGNILSEINVWAPRGHMAKIIPQVDAVLREAGMEKEAVEAFVVGTGPGSFTGLRIGVTVARTLAQFLDRPIVGTASANGMARRLAFFDGLVCVVIDAKRGEVYAGVYGAVGSPPARISGFQPVSPDALSDVLADMDGKVLFTGDGSGIYRDVFATKLGDRASFAPEDFWWPRAADVAFSSASRLVEDDFDDLDLVVPVYARLSQAEELWQKKREDS